MVQRAQELLYLPGETKQIFSLDELQWGKKAQEEFIIFWFFKELEGWRESWDCDESNHKCLILNKQLLYFSRLKGKFEILVNMSPRFLTES